MLDNKTAIAVIAGLVVGSVVASGLSFYKGLEYSRNQIRQVAETIANDPVGTNSFSVCLTQMWEQTGELDPDWKGQRKWRLTEGE